ncbi:hypothetical protein PIB30_025494 [Stylosanthes scabra]|uniref:Uncharacterized protein n=1 Tax=Stylosanthes scabra TaxID=79078 RepID=A0ABU6XA49_9FABA|nr:hypothetical protein [Stylosanthes scabra]
MKINELSSCKVQYGTSKNNFKYDTKYYYRIGSGGSFGEFWFKTPPKVGPDAPYKFGIIEQFLTVMVLPVPNLLVVSHRNKYACSNEVIQVETILRLSIHKA